MPARHGRRVRIRAAGNANAAMCCPALALALCRHRRGREPSVRSPTMAVPISPKAAVRHCSCLAPRASRRCSPRCSACCLRRAWPKRAAARGARRRSARSDGVKLEAAGAARADRGRARFLPQQGRLYELAGRVQLEPQWITPHIARRHDRAPQPLAQPELGRAAAREGRRLRPAARCDRRTPSVPTRATPTWRSSPGAGGDDLCRAVPASRCSSAAGGIAEADKGDALLKETLAAMHPAAARARPKLCARPVLRLRHDQCHRGRAGHPPAAVAPVNAAVRVRAPAAFVTDELRAELQRLRGRAQARIHPSAVPIFASDVSFRMVDFARRNAQRAWGRRSRSTAATRWIAGADAACRAR